MAQKLICPPLLGKFYGRPPQIAMVLIKLAFKSAEQRKRVRGRTGEACEDLLLIETANFLRAMLDYGLTERDLAVPSHNDRAISTDTQNCRGTYSRRGLSFG